MKSLKYLYIPAAISIFATALLYTRLPAMVPTHWEASGAVDIWKPRYILVFTALLPVAFLYLLQKVPAMAPDSEGFAQHETAYGVISAMVVFFIIALHWYSIAAAMEIFLRVSMLMKGLLGLLFIIIGRIMPHAQPGHTFSILTPWTFDDEEVRIRTQKAGGRMLMGAGCIMIIALALPAKASFFVVAGAVFACIIGIYLYSYLLRTRTED